MIDELRTFQIVSSIKLHFSQKSYDYKKYKYNSRRFNMERLLKKNDRFMYKALGKRFDDEVELERFCAANYFYQPSTWVGSLLEEQSNDCYLRYTKYNQSKLHYVVEDVKLLINKHGKFVSSLDGGILDDTVSGYIHPESFILLNRVYDVAKHVEARVGNNVIYETVLERLMKYDAFITVPNLDFYDQIRHNLYNVVSQN